LIGPSKTFTPGSDTLTHAVNQAREAIQNSAHIPPSLKDKALKSLEFQDYVTRTPGVGPGARSSGI